MGSAEEEPTGYCSSIVWTVIVLSILAFGAWMIFFRSSTPDESIKFLNGAKDQSGKPVDPQELKKHEGNARAWIKQATDVKEIDRRLKEVYGDCAITEPSAPGKPSKLAQCCLAVRTLEKEAPAGVMIYLRKHLSKTTTPDECTTFLTWQRNAPQAQRKLAMLLMISMDWQDPEDV